MYILVHKDMKSKNPIEKKVLENLYFGKKLSMMQMSKILKCSSNKVAYWMKKYKLYRRDLSESAYVFNNPNGDPFIFREPRNKEEAILYGIGIGLYWGEGTKANKHSIRLGNTDPDLILTFISFLNKFFSISKNKLSFGIQIFSEMSVNDVLNFWCNKLDVKKSQFMKTIITPTRGVGTYSKKIKHGVLTVYFHNIKARNIMFNLIEKRRQKR